MRDDMNFVCHTPALSTEAGGAIIRGTSKSRLAPAVTKKLKQDQGKPRDEPKNSAERLW